jgi:transcriptional regulator with PAS, ATPase and Fis domain
VLLGETGTGKEVVARILHANSARAARPFVAVNCAAIPGELLESELFGHAQGAFTGARTPRQGLFESAAGGTLFLDEIGDLPLPLQTKLLRALAEGEVRRVGESEAFHVDVRVVCATHRDLQHGLQAGTFREDLYYRINVFQLRLPPLRERPDDIVPLAELFLARERHAAGLQADALAALLAHAWPGNVRELANAMKHGAVLSQGEPIAAAHLPLDLIRATARPAPPAPVGQTLAEIERHHIHRVLDECHGELAAAARVLGIGRTTLWRKLRADGELG